MLFKSVLMGLAVSASAVSISKRGGGDSIGSCNTGNIQCCSTTKDKQESTGKNDALLSLGDVADQVAVQCDQIPLVIGIAIEDECKNTPSCCEDVEGGLLSCSPLALI